MIEVLCIVLGFAAPAGMATVLRRMSPYRRSKLGLLLRPIPLMPQLEDHPLELEPELAHAPPLQPPRPEASSSAHGHAFIQLDQDVEGVVSAANFWRKKWHNR